MGFGTDTIATFQTSGTYSVRRYGTGTTTAGEYDRGSPSTFTITGSEQASSGRAMRDLKEGQVAGDVKTLFTGTALYTVDTHGTADEVQLNDGLWYRVTKVEGFFVISDHYRVTVEKIGVP